MGYNSFPLRSEKKTIYFIQLHVHVPVCSVCRFSAFRALIPPLLNRSVNAPDACPGATRCLSYSPCTTPKAQPHSRVTTTLQHTHELTHRAKVLSHGDSRRELSCSW